MISQAERRYLPIPHHETAQAGRLILRDGSTVGFRPAGPSDISELARFFENLEEEAVPESFSPPELGRLFLGPIRREADPRLFLMLVATRIVGGEEHVIAAGGYRARGLETAAMSIAVTPEFRGKGLATLLLERLALLAASHDFRRFRVITYSANRSTIDFFRDSGLLVEERQLDGTVEMDLLVTSGPARSHLAEIRDRLLTATSLRPFFRPRSVAVVGASRRPEALGHRILKALLERPFQGPIYPINPSAGKVAETTAFASLLEVPGPVDLAVAAVPAGLVSEVVDDCAEKKVPALVVITAGFAEMGQAGRRLQQQLIEKVRGHGIRLLGPNCMGVLNTDPAVLLNASFSPVFPPAGTVAMSSQSGALGVGVLTFAKRLGLGLSSFVSVGNQADVTSNDLLQYWEEDPRTEVILLYLESFGAPRQFARIARRVSRRKPVVAVKSGRTGSGRRAAGSHTAALASSEVAADALFRQTGIIRAATLQEMFDLAVCLSRQPLPRGRRLAVLTNAGGPAILAVDAAEAKGLTTPELAESTQQELSTLLTAEASKLNPVDMTAAAGPDEYRKAIEILLGADEVETLLVIFVPADLSQEGAIHAAIRHGIRNGRDKGGRGKPVAACLLGQEAESSVLKIGSEEAPSYPFPEQAARVLASIADYAEWRRRPPGRIPEFTDAFPAVARQVCRQSLHSRGKGWLSYEEMRKVLQSMGLPLLQGEVAATADEAARVASSLGFPVAAKLTGRRFVHKSDLGGVILGLSSPDAVKEAFEKIAEAGRRAGDDSSPKALIQPMQSEGVEVMAGVVNDPLFGPLVAFGLGGPHVEVLGDVSFRVPPLTEQDAAEMVREIRGHQLLKGFRGRPPADLEAIQDVLLRVARLIDQVPEIAELDLNPVFALPPGEGCRIADARIAVAPLEE